MFRALLALLALLAFCPGIALAQANQCVIPDRLPQPLVDAPPGDRQRRIVPIAGYTLALSWSPQYCRGAGRDDALQCGRRNGRFGFILHGLWPEGAGHAWPQYCAAPGPVPQQVIRSQFCAMPSIRLIQHQWAKHGTCMAKAPGEYYARARAVHGALRYPDMNRLSRRPDLKVADLLRAFSAANRGLGTDMVRVDVTRDGWLREVRVCLDKGFRPARCPVRRSGAAPGLPLKVRAF